MAKEVQEVMFADKRANRVGDLLQRELSELLIRRIKDPRLHSITITSVKVSRDLRHARVYYNTLTGGAPRNSVEVGLRKARGFIKRELGRRIHLRYIPDLEFLWDDTLDYAAHIEELLKKAKVIEDDSEDN